MALLGRERVEMLVEVVIELRWHEKITQILFGAIGLELRVKLQQPVHPALPEVEQSGALGEMLEKIRKIIVLHPEDASIGITAAHEHEAAL